MKIESLYISENLRYKITSVFFPIVSLLRLLSFCLKCYPEPHKWRTLSVVLVWTRAKWRELCAQNYLKRWSLNVSHAASPSLLSCFSWEMRNKAAHRLDISHKGALTLSIKSVQSPNTILSSKNSLCKFKTLSERRLNTLGGNL